MLYTVYYSMPHISDVKFLKGMDFRHLFSGLQHSRHELACSTLVLLYYSYEQKWYDFCRVFICEQRTYKNLCPKINLKLAYVVAVIVGCFFPKEQSKK